MIKNYIEKANFEDTGFSYTLSLINGKYKMVILYCLMEFGVVRYSELKRYIRTISHKTLSLSLKELEKDRLIIRTEYPQIPPKVEYAQSGIQPVGARQITDDDTRPALYMGRGK